MRLLCLFTGFFYFFSFAQAQPINSLWHGKRVSLSGEVIEVSDQIFRIGKETCKWINTPQPPKSKGCWATYSAVRSVEEYAKSLKFPDSNSKKTLAGLTKNDKFKSIVILETDSRGENVARGADCGTHYIFDKGTIVEVSECQMGNQFEGRFTVFSTQGVGNIGQPPLADTMATKSTSIEKPNTKDQVATPHSTVQFMGSNPIDNQLALKLCQEVAVINPSGISPLVGKIFAIEYFPEVHGSSIWGSIGPQVKVTPVKVYATYPSGKHYTPGVLIKDVYGQYNCKSSKL